MSDESIQLVDVSKLSKLRRVKLAKRAISRMVCGEISPEQKLFMRVILMGVEDLLIPEGVIGNARCYFTDRFPFDVHAELAGVEPESVLLILKQAQLIDSTAQHHAA